MTPTIPKSEIPKLLKVQGDICLKCYGKGYDRRIIGLNGQILNAFENKKKQFECKSCLTTGKALTEITYVPEECDACRNAEEEDVYGEFFGCDWCEDGKIHPILKEVIYMDFDVTTDEYYFLSQAEYDLLCHATEQQVKMTKITPIIVNKKKLTMRCYVE